MPSNGSGDDQNVESGEGVEDKKVASAAPASPKSGPKWKCGHNSVVAQQRKLSPPSLCCGDRKPNRDRDDRPSVPERPDLSDDVVNADFVCNRKAQINSRVRRRRAGNNEYVIGKSTHYQYDDSENAANGSRVQRTAGNGYIGSRLPVTAPVKASSRCCDDLCGGRKKVKCIQNDQNQKK